MSQPTIEKRVAVLEGRLENIESSMVRIEKYAEQASARREFNLAHLGVIIAIILGVGGVGVSYINTVVRPLDQKAATSETDRHKINDSLDKLEQGQADLLTEVKSNQSALNAKLIEIETQFASADQMRNANQANNMRFIALLWEKTYGTRFPSEIQYYPSISQHDR